MAHQRRGARQWTSTQLLGPVVIDEPAAATCTITWTYPEPIRERLVKPAQYTRVLLEISSQMRSYAASVLYELGARLPDLTRSPDHARRRDLVGLCPDRPQRHHHRRLPHPAPRDTIRRRSRRTGHALRRLQTGNRRAQARPQGRRTAVSVLPKPQVSLAGLRDSAKNVFDLELVERVITLGLKRTDAQDLQCDHRRRRPARGSRARRATHLEELDAAAAELATGGLRDALKQYAGEGKTGRRPTWPFHANIA